MLSEQVIFLLQRAGITDIDRLLPVLSALKCYLEPSEQNETHPLTATEMRFLSMVGASDLDQPDVGSKDQWIASTIVAYMAVVNRSLPEVSLAIRMGLDGASVRRLYEGGKLFGIAGPDGLVFPKFQFVECGGKTRIIPGFDAVMSEIPCVAHPLALEQFFLNQCPDLELGDDSEPLSPRKWLIDGRDPGPICKIVREF